MGNDRERPQTTRAARSRAILSGPLGALPIMLGVVAGLALCGVGLVALNSFSGGRPPAPSSMVGSICDDLSAQKYDDLYSLLAPNLQQQGSQTQFVASQRELDIVLGPVTSCHDATSWTGTGAARATLTLERKSEATSVVTLIYRQSDWRIDAFDNNF